MPDTPQDDPQTESVPAEENAGTDPADLPPKPIPRFRIAFNAALQTFLLLFIVVVVNYLSCRHHEQWDLTSNRRFTLSSTTTQFLDSLDQNVTFIVAFLAGSPVTNDVRALVEEYERHSRQRVKTSYLDPGRDRAQAADLVAKYDISLDQNAVIIVTGDRVRLVPESAMVARDENGLGRITEFHGEAVLTSALIEAVEKEKKKLYLVTGHRPLTDLQVLMKQVHGPASLQNAEIHELLFSRADAIPDDCDCLVLIGPQVDLSPREIDMLRTYWETEKGSLFLMLDPAAKTPNLHAFIRAYGVIPRDDRVLLAAGVSGLEIQKSYIVPAVFLPGSAVTRELVGLNTRLPRQSQSLRVRENDPLLKADGITVTPLLIADERFWGETAYTEDTVSFDQLEDHLQPLYLAASIEKGAAEDPRLRIKSSRMVVTGNANLLDSAPERIKPNYDFFMSAVNWMLDREELIGITPKLPTVYSLNLSSKQYSRLQLFVLIVMPAGAFFLAFTTWSIRRH